MRIPLPDTPAAAETLCMWVITAPAYHPFWSQYVLGVVRLRFDTPGFPDPVLKFPGATHELHVLVLDPERGPYTVKSVVASNFALTYVGVNIAEQFEATDEEMLEVAGRCAQGVVFGVLNPETGDAPARIREDWLATITVTLAHMRGEPHAARAGGPIERVIKARSPAGCTSDPAAIEHAKKLTHDGLIRAAGHRRRSGIRWHIIRGRALCLKFVEEEYGDTDLDATHLARLDQLRAFAGEHPDDCVLVVAECEIVDDPAAPDFGWLE